MSKKKIFSFLFLFSLSFKSYSSDDLLLVVSYFANNKGIKRKAGGAGHIHVTLYKVYGDYINEGFKANIWDDELNTDIFSLKTSDQMASNRMAICFSGSYSLLKDKWFEWWQVKKKRRHILSYNCAVCSIDIVSFLTNKLLNRAVILPSHAWGVISGALGTRKLSQGRVDHFLSY